MHRVWIRIEVVAVLGKPPKHDSIRSLLRDSVQLKPNTRYGLEDIHQSECFKCGRSTNLVRSDICKIRTGTSCPGNATNWVLTALQDLSNVRPRFIGAVAALQGFNTLATSATPCGEEGPERRDTLISTAALEAGKWLHTTLAYSNVSHHRSSAVTCACWSKAAIAGSSMQRCCHSDGAPHDAKSKACPILLMLVG